MSGKRKHDNSLAATDRDGSCGTRSMSGSGSERSMPDGKTAIGNRLAADERRGDKWHKRTTVPSADGIIYIDNSSAVPPTGSRRSHAHHGFPPRPARTRALESLEPDVGLPNSPTAQGKDEGRGTLYPPIITIDGRVDTDLDHLIEDDNDEDHNYDGPVEELPSRYPKPHVFSVIHGSLDDDVDSYANDDGTMEHTLVDAPKSFHLRDLKDVASTDTADTRARPGQTKGGGGAGGSQLMSYSDRSHNKMHTEGGEAEGPPETGGGGGAKYQPPQQQQQHQQQSAGLRPQPRGQTKAGGECRRQVCSEERLQRGTQRDPPSQAGALSDSLTASPHRGSQPEAGPVECWNWRPPAATTAAMNSDCEDERDGAREKSGAGRCVETSCRSDGVGGAAGEIAGVRHSQSSPGRSISEQTQKSEDCERAKDVRRPMSCTPKHNRVLQCPGKNSLNSSPKRSVTRAPQNDGCVSDEEHTFVTCHEATCSSAMELALIDRQRRHDSVAVSDKLPRSDAKNYRRKSPGHGGPRKTRGESNRVESDMSISGLDSIGSDVYDDGPSREAKRQERYCSDPPAGNAKTRPSEVEVSKSDTRAASYRTSTHHDGVRQNYCRTGVKVLPQNFHRRRSHEPAEGVDAVEWYEDAAQSSGQRHEEALKRRNGTYRRCTENNSQENQEFFDAKECDTQENPFTQNTQKASKRKGHHDQEHIPMPRAERQEGYRSNFTEPGTGNRKESSDQKETERQKSNGSIPLNRKEKSQSTQRRHLGNTIWHDLEGFEPILASQNHVRLKSQRRRLYEENRGHNNTRRGSKSPPPRGRRKLSSDLVRETNNSRNGRDQWRDISRSPAKHGRHGRFSPENQKEELSLLNASTQQQIAHIGMSLLDLEEEESSLSPNTWNGTDRAWRKGASGLSPVDDRTDQYAHYPRERRGSVSSRDRRIKQQRTPHASWSFDSGHSRRAYRHAHRMIPRQNTKISQREREDLARTVGTSVDGKDPADIIHELSELSQLIGDVPTSSLGANSTDEDLKESLKQAMAIARESLSAAARVSKALNLVMTSSCLSIDSCSLRGSSTDPRSPRYFLEPTPPSEQILRWGRTQKNSSVSSRFTDMSGVSLNCPLPAACPPSLPPASHIRASPGLTASCEEPSRIGRSNDTSTHSDGRRSRSVAAGRDRVLTIVPGAQNTEKRADGTDSSAPLVSIYIGAPGPHQQVARIFSSRTSIQQDYSQVSSLCKDRSYLPESSSARLGRLECYHESGKTVCSRNESYEKPCLLEGKHLSLKKDIEKLSYFPVKEQTVCVNMFTTEGIKHENISGPRLSGSSSSQTYESTVETLVDEKKYRASRKSLGDDKNTGSKSRAKKASSSNKRKKYHEAPTREDGSKHTRKRRASSQRTDHSSQGPERLKPPGDDKSMLPGRIFSYKDEQPSNYYSLFPQGLAPTPQDLSECMSMFPPQSGMPDSVAPSLAYLSPHPDELPHASRTAMMEAALGYLAAHPSGGFSQAVPPLDAIYSLKREIYSRPNMMHPPGKDTLSGPGMVSHMNSFPPHGASLSPRPVQVASPLSPGSCVDPTGYQSDGSAVDPPRRPFFRNFNANKARETPHNFNASVDHNREEIADAYSDQLINERSACDNSDNNVRGSVAHPRVTTNGASKCKPSDGKGNKKETAEKQTILPNELFCDARQSGFIAKNVNSNKSGCFSLKQDTALECKDTRYDKKKHSENVGKLSGNNVNNNSATGEDAGAGCLLRTLENEGESDNEVDRSPHSGGKSSSRLHASDRNQNQPRLHRRGNSPRRRQTLSQALHMLALAREGDEETVAAPNSERRGSGVVVVKKRGRHRDASSSRRVKKSLCMAMQLAEESLSAAARVTQLLNQVVDVYQYRHPTDAVGVARLGMQKKAMAVGRILPKNNSLKALEFSKMEAVEYVGDHRLKEQQLSSYLDDPSEPDDMPKLRRHRRIGEPIDGPENDRRIASPKKSYRLINSGRRAVQGEERIRTSNSPDDESKHEKQERRRSNSREIGNTRGYYIEKESKRAESKRSSPLRKEMNKRRAEQSGNMDIQSAFEKVETNETMFRDNKRQEKHSSIHDAHLQGVELKKNTYKCSKTTNEIQEEAGGKYDHSDMQKDERAQNSQVSLYKGRKKKESYKTLETMQNCSEREREDGCDTHTKTLNVSPTDLKKRTGLQKRDADVTKSILVDEEKKLAKRQVATDKLCEKGETREDRQGSPKQKTKHENNELKRDRKYAQEGKGVKSSVRIKATSPAKTTDMQDDIENAGTSVDDPRLIIYGQEECQRITCDRPKFQGKSLGKIESDLAMRASPLTNDRVFEGGNRRCRSPRKTRMSSKKPSLFLEDTEANASQSSVPLDVAVGNPASGDTASLKKKTKKSEKERPQGPKDKSRSPRNVRVSDKRTARHQSSPDNARPRSNPVDNPALFNTIVAAAASIVGPSAAGSEGENCSFNRSLDLAGCPTQGQCVPVKHRYPTSPVKTKKARSDQESGRTCPNDVTKEWPQNDGTLTSTDKEEFTRFEHGAWCDPTDADAFLYKPSPDVENAFAPNFNYYKEENQSGSSTPAQPRVCTDTIVTERQEDSFPDTSDLIESGRYEDNSKADNSSRSNEVNSFHSSEIRPSNSVEEDSSSTITLKANGHRNIEDQIQRNAQDLRMTKASNCHEKRLEATRRNNEYPCQSAAGMTRKGFAHPHEANGSFISCNRSEWRRSFSVSDDESSSPTVSSSDDAEPETRHSSRYQTESSYFSSPEKSDTKNQVNVSIPKNTHVERYLGNCSRSSSPEKSDSQRRAYSALKRENSFHLAGSPGNNSRCPGLKQQNLSLYRQPAFQYPPGNASTTSYTTGTPEQAYGPRWSAHNGNGLTPPPDVECDDYNEGADDFDDYADNDRDTWLINLSSEERQRFTPHGHIQQKDFSVEQPGSSQGGSLRSYTVSPSLTGTEDDYNLRNFDVTSTTQFPDAALIRGFPPHNVSCEKKFIDRESVSLRFRESKHDLPPPGNLCRVPEQLLMSSEGNSPGLDEASQGDTTLNHTSGDVPSTVGAMDGRIDQPGSSNRGLYPLYRPLDNMRPGSFSPIIEESEITGFGMIDRPSLSSVHASRHVSQSSNNNCNRDAFQAQAGGGDNSASIAQLDDFGAESLRCNTNNNASSGREGTFADLEPSTNKVSQVSNLEVQQTSDGCLVQRLPMWRRCRSKSVVPQPFCRHNRVPLPLLKPPRQLKFSEPFGHLTEHERWRLRTDNAKLCKRLVDTGKNGCTFDTGMRKPYRRPMSNKTVQRMSHQEEIARQNERLFMRIVTKQSFYKREEQLKDYDKKLPKLLSFSRNPEALIKMRNIHFV